MRHDHDGQPFFRDHEQATERLPLRNQRQARRPHRPRRQTAGRETEGLSHEQPPTPETRCSRSLRQERHCSDPDRHEGRDQKGKQIKQLIKSVLERPGDFTGDEHFGQFARDVIADREFVRPEPIAYRTWGNEIDEASHAQMRQACGVPMAAGAALMPDAHVGYGLPIGGVLALEGAVIRML